MSASVNASADTEGPDIRNDPKYKKFKKIYKEASRISLTTWLEEIENAHSVRKSRRLGLENRGLSATNVAEALMEDQGYRSRIIEIQSQVTKFRAWMKQAYENTFDQILTKHYADIPGGTKGLKEQWVHNKLDFGHKLLSRMDNLLNTADMVVGDIDKAAWSMHNTIKAIEIINSNDREI